MSDDSSDKKNIEFSFFNGAGGSYKYDGWSEVDREISCSVADGKTLFQNEREEHPRQKIGSGLTAALFDPDLVDDDDVEHSRRKMNQASEIHGIALDVESVHPADPDADVDDVPRVPWPEEVIDALPYAAWVWSSFNHGIHRWDEQPERGCKLRKSSPDHPRYHLVWWLKDPLKRKENEQTVEFRKRYSDLRSHIIDWLDEQIDTENWYDGSAKDATRLLWGARPRQEGAEQAAFSEVYDDLPFLDVTDLPGGVSLSELTEKRKERERREREAERERLRKMKEGEWDSPDADRQQKYAMAAVERIANDLRSASKGERHNSIIEAGLQAGGFEKADMISGYEVISILGSAGKSILPSSRHNEVVPAIEWGMDRADRFDVSKLSDDYERSAAKHLEEGEDFVRMGDDGSIGFPDSSSTVSDDTSEDEDCQTEADDGDARVAVDADHPVTLILKGVSVGASMRILRWMEGEGCPPLIIGAADEETVAAVWAATSEPLDEEAYVRRVRALKGRVKGRLKYLLKEDDDVPVSDYLDEDGEMALSVHAPRQTPYWTDESAIIVDKREDVPVVDFDREIEKTDTSVETPEGEFFYGSWCCLEYAKDGDEEGEVEKVHEPIAEDVWPVCTVTSLDDGSRYVRLRAVDDAGREQHHHVDMSAFSGRQSDKIGDLVGHLKITPGQDKRWVESIDWWRQKASKEDLTLTRHQGWMPDDGRDGHRIYIQGSESYGDRWVTHGAAARTRDKTAGTLEDWQEAVREYATTPVLKGAIAVSLAGSVLEPLGHPTWMMHYFGRSSSGKTTAGKLGVSVWGAPENGEMVKTWRATDNAIEGIARDSSGACLLLDELKMCGSERVVREAIMMLASEKGKSRLTADIQRREPMTWKETVISTGENSLIQWLRSKSQGGEEVRALNCRVEQGDAGASYDHARGLEDAVCGAYGHAGRAFVKHLREADWDGLKDQWKRIHQRLCEDTDSAEGQRIAGHLATMEVALKRAWKWEVVEFQEAPWEGSVSRAHAVIEQVTYWHMERILDERGDVQGPFDRALQNLRERWIGQPSRFPTKSDYKRNSYGDVYGVVEGDIVDKLREADANEIDVGFDTGSGTIITSESMLKQSDICRDAGTTARSFLRECRGRGLADYREKERIGGRQINAYHIPMNDG